MSKSKASNQKFKSWSDLIKIRLSLTVALSSLAGYFLYEHAFNEGVVFLVLGVMLLASGVAIINQCQEHATDALMPRTCNRPLPSGKINPTLALIFALVIILLGLVIINFANGFLVALLGLLNALWYNLVYTPLKRKTAFAVIPGSVCGAIPPLMGWVAAGGNIWHPKIWLLVFFFFVWQIPHFWLILLKYGNEYANAGLPSITKLLNRDQLRNITFVWLIASGVAALFLPLFSMVITQKVKIVLVIMVFIYVLLGFWSLFKSQKFINYTMAFMVVNLFMLGLILLIIIDKLSFSIF